MVFHIVYCVNMPIFIGLLLANTFVAVAVVWMCVFHQFKKVYPLLVFVTPLIIYVNSRVCRCSQQHKVWRTLRANLVCLFWVYVVSGQHTRRTVWTITHIML